MTQLFEFPGADERDWAKVESSIYSGLKKDGLTDDIIYRAANLFKPFWLIIKNDMSIDSPIMLRGEFTEKQVEAINESVRADLLKHRERLQQGTTKLIKRIHLLCVAKAMDEMPNIPPRGNHDRD